MIWQDSANADHNERGERQAAVPVEADAEERAAIRIDPKYKTVWYEISCVTTCHTLPTVRLRN